MSTVRQEFLCNDCPGYGYIMVEINVSLNRRIFFVCPKCGAKHRRYIADGHIKESALNVGRNEKEEEILVPRSAWSAEPRAKKMLQQKTIARDGVIISSDDDLIEKKEKSLMDGFKEAWRRSWRAERFAEIADREKNG